MPPTDAIARLAKHRYGYQLWFWWAKKIVLQTFCIVEFCLRFIKISKTIELICIANLLAYSNKTSLITQRNEAVDI